MAEQIGAPVADLAAYDWLGRSGRRHRAEILAHLGFRRARQQDMRDAAAWTGSELCPLGLPASEMMERLLGWFVERRIAAPGEEALGALIVTARRTFEDKVLEAIASSLSPEHRRGLDASLADEDGATSFSDLKADPGQPNLDNILIAAKRLAFVKGLALPVRRMSGFERSCRADASAPRVQRNRLDHAPASRWATPRSLCAVPRASAARAHGWVGRSADRGRPQGRQPGQEAGAQGVHRGDRAGPRQGRIAGQDR